MDTPETLLKKYWGYPAFLPHQEAIITSVIRKQDTLAIMATGSGKSLCYQLPAVYFGGLTLVISPLIALMKDQADDLNARGIPAAAYHSSLEYRERCRIEADMKNGSLRLLFVSPEKCMQAHFLASLKSAPVRLIAIDEAHCISEWGHNFRPEYRQLAQVKKNFPDAPVVALTATAVPEVRKDICQQLGLVQVREFIGSFNRKNLRYRVAPKKNPLVQLVNFLVGHRNETGIVYCLSRKETEEVAAYLTKHGFPALAYHAGLPQQARETVQDAFIHDATKIVCATVAFGMGIDKPDVRFVVHYDLPKTLESYYQETGRAGRDGKPGECLLLYSRGDYARARSMIEHDDASEQAIRIAIRKLLDMTEYCETTGCRRRHLLRYFGEDFPNDNCHSCDNCDHPSNRVDGTVPARLIAGCVKQLPAHFGIDMIADVLRGSGSVKIRDYGFDRLPSYGTGKNYSRAQYRLWITDLVRQGYLLRNGDTRPVIALTKKGAGLLSGTCRVMLPEQNKEETPGTAPRTTSRGRKPAVETDLFDRLKNPAPVACTAEPGAAIPGVFRQQS